MDDRTKLLNIVAFLCLMENNGGVLNKSPDYILEKYKRYCEGAGEEYKWGLDQNNLVKLFSWAKRWRIMIGGDEDENE